MAIQPPQRFELDDLAHVEREARTIYAPGATPGDVLVVQSDHSLVAAPGGGSQPVQAVYQGNTVTIADGVNANLTFDSLLAGVELLDRTDPASPVFLQNGWYLLIGSVVCASAFTAGGFAVLNVNLPEPILGALTATGEAPNMQYGCAVPNFGFANAGDANIGLEIVNRDGAASRDFSVNATILTKIA